MIKIRGWLPLTTEPQDLIVVGRLYAVTQHYVLKWATSAACIAPGECQLCLKNHPVQTLAALPVKKLDSDDVYLLRLLTSQKSLLSLFSSVGPDLIGRRIQAERRSPQHPKVAMVKMTKARIPTHELDCSKYIGAIGRRAYEAIAKDLLRQEQFPEG